MRRAVNPLRSVVLLKTPVIGLIHEEPQRAAHQQRDGGGPPYVPQRRAETDDGRALTYSLGDLKYQGKEA